MIFVFTISFSSIFITAFLFMAVSITMKYLAIWRYLRFLQTKDAMTYFDFPSGYVKCLKDGEEKGDSFFWSKQMIQINPKARLVATHFALTPSIQLIDPDLIKEFYANQQKYIKSSMWSIYVRVMGKGLLFSEGALWKKHRKILSEMFRFDRMASQLPEIAKLCKDLITNECPKNQRGVNLLELARNITGQLVFRLFFGKVTHDTYIEDEKATLFLARFLGTLDENTFAPESLFFGPSVVFRRIFPRNRRLISESAKFRNFCLGLINKSTEEFQKGKPNGSIDSSSKCILMKLIEARYKENEEDKLSDEEILHEYITFFLAGMDTTAQWLTMSMYYFGVCISDTDRNAILNEASTIANAGERTTHELLSGCPHMIGLLKETLRFATPAPVFFDRQASKDHYIGDLLIKKGSVININFMANHFNPEYFKEPKEFNIHRWIPGSKEFEESVIKNPFIFTPFSSGTRNCIGQHLAMIEVKILMSILLANFEVHVPRKEMKMALRFVYEPQEPLLVDIFSKCVG